LLTEAAAERLKDSDVAGAQGIILEVLTNPEFAQGHTPAAISVFQEIRAADAQLAVLSGHRGAVFSAAYSPDGTRIVTASTDKTARIWDPRTGAPLAVLSGHGGHRRSAAYSPDGTRIVTASMDKTARIWDARTGAARGALRPWGCGLVRRLLARRHPHRHRVGTRPRGSGMRARGRRSRCSPVMAMIVYSAAYSPDGTRIVTASLTRPRGSGMRAPAHSSRCSPVMAIASIPPPTRPTARASSPPRTTRPRGSGMRARGQLAVLSGHGGGRLFRRLLARRHPHRHRLGDKTARIWDARTGAQLAVLSGHGDFVNSAAYSPDGTRIVTASIDKTARIWDARTGAHSSRCSPAMAVRLFRRLLARRHPHRHRLGRQDRAHLGCAHGRTARGALRPWRSRLSAAYSPDGTRIVTASMTRLRASGMRAQGSSSRCSPAMAIAVYSAAYSPDGTRIVTASADKTARIWDARTQGHSSRCSPAMAMESLPPPTRPTARASSPPRLTRPRASGMRAPGRSSRCSPAMAVRLSAAYSPDGTRIVTASVDKTARIWDARTGAPARGAVRPWRFRLYRRLLARRHPHRHRIGRQDRAYLGCAHGRAPLAVLSGHGDVIGCRLLARRHAHRHGLG
jgi:WD40 repeat protein